MTRPSRLGAGPAAVAAQGSAGVPAGEALAYDGRRGWCKTEALPSLEGGIAAACRWTGLRISVSHFPPGTSKWNKMAHRMCCHIAENWRGRPLVSREVVVDLIGHPTTTTGLTIPSALDETTPRQGERSQRNKWRASPSSGTNSTANEITRFSREDKMDSLFWRASSKDGSLHSATEYDLQSAVAVGQNPAAVPPMCLPPTCWRSSEVGSCPCDATARRS